MKKPKKQYICIWHKSCPSPDGCLHAKVHDINKDTDSGRGCNIEEQCGTIGAAVKCVPENYNNFVTNKIYKIVLDIDEASGELLDFTCLYADNRKEPFGISEFRAGSETRLKLEALQKDINKALKKTKINGENND